MDTKNIIQKITELCTDNLISVNKQIVLFVSTRKLLEKENIKRDFLVVLLYCNWVLHPDIDRDPECGPIIEQITKSFFIMEEQRMNALGLEILILKSLKFYDLILQFRQLYSKYSLPTGIFTPQKVSHFLNQLITKILLDQTITLNPKYSKKYFNSITQRTKGKKIMAIDSFSFQFIPDYGGPNDPTYCFVAKNRNTVSLNTPLTLSVWQNIVLSKGTRFDALLD